MHSNVDASLLELKYVLEVMSSNPGRVELGVHGTSVLSHT